MSQTNSRTLVVFSSVLLGFASFSAAEGRGRQPRVVVRMQRVNVPKPSPVRAEHRVNDEHRAAVPARDERGRAIVRESARLAPAHHAEIVRNPAFVRNIEARERSETLRNHYYWHADGGLRYAHYYDPHGIHWYGFYHGPTFYWTRYYVGRWWWYDARFLRWVYWWNGYWWWTGPGGVEYVFVSNSYYPYETGGVVTVQTPEVQAPPAAVPAPDDGMSTWSQDRSRMVQIFGPNSEAFLYDKSPGHSSFLQYLAANVASVKFSGGSGDKPLQILLNFKDGAFAVFDANGRPVEAPAAADLPPAGDLPPGAPDAPQ